MPNKAIISLRIVDESAVPSAEELQKDADSLDETAAYVEVSEESRKKIEAIENVIGDSVCCLCKVGTVR
ncbi:hypothetical protein ANCDUO_19120 [Ancylostoma duodenale]|uniref:Uncharacterized protein n=1 Tax=Ancylostoma duodenale TaxID=51022 RepID=A0A0C2C3D6_9BILA|nr:hypothetical protein ANCDUO_19120 [Ancylostoma duodenale]